MAALALATLVLFADGCAWRKPAGQTGYRAEAQTAAKTPQVEIAPLLITPDVDAARAVDLGGGRKIYHSDRDLLYADGDQFFPIVVRSFPRIVGLSPDKKYFAFLDPSEFEMAADLYAFDVPALSLRRLTGNHDDPATTRSVKAAQWFNDRTLYYLEGFRYGTVSRGGDLWRVDVPRIERRPVVQIKRSDEGFEEIIEFNFLLDRKTIHYVTAHYDEIGIPIRSSHYCTLDGRPVP